MPASTLRRGRWVVFPKLANGQLVLMIINARTELEAYAKARACLAQRGYQCESLAMTTRAP